MRRQTRLCLPYKLGILTPITTSTISSSGTGPGDDLRLVSPRRHVSVVSVESGRSQSTSDCGAEDVSAKHGTPRFLGRRLTYCRSLGLSNCDLLVLWRQSAHFWPRSPSPRPGLQQAVTRSLAVSCFDGVCGVNWYFKRYGYGVTVTGRIHAPPVQPCSESWSRLSSQLSRCIHSVTAW